MRGRTEIVVHRPDPPKDYGLYPCGKNICVNHEGVNWLLDLFGHIEKLEAAPGILAK